MQILLLTSLPPLNTRRDSALINQLPPLLIIPRPLNVLIVKPRIIFFAKWDLEAGIKKHLNAANLVGNKGITIMAIIKKQMVTTTTASMAMMATLHQCVTPTTRLVIFQQSVHLPQTTLILPLSMSGLNQSQNHVVIEVGHIFIAGKFLKLLPCPIRYFQRVNGGAQS